MIVALRKPVRVSEMLAMLGSSVRACVGPSDGAVGAAASLGEREGANAVAFCLADGAAAQREIGASTAAVVICRPDAASRLGTASAKTLIGVENPRLAFIQLLGALATPPTATAAGVAGSAAVSPSARIGREVAIGEMAIISEACEIGDGTRIDAAVVLHPGTHIGRHCAISGRGGNRRRRVWFRTRCRWTAAPVSTFRPRRDRG